MKSRRRKYTAEESALPPRAKKTKPALTPEELTLITSALISPRDWFADYGAAYDIQSSKRIADLCDATRRTFRRRADSPTFPRGWDCAKLGARWYLFIVDPALVCAPKHNRGKIQRRSAPPPSVTPELVEKAFSTLFTVAEWLEHVGRPVYGFTEVSYINQLTWERPWGNSHQASTFPPGWKPVRLGRSYLIHHETLLPKSLWFN